MVDKIIQGKTRSRRQYASYYTESDPILDFMVSRLQIQSGDKILEPAAGGGAFIGKILDTYPDMAFTIDGYDLNPEALKQLETRFDDERVKTRLVDTLLDDELDLIANSGGYYNKIIANPPYGAWQDTEKRQLLKLRYGGYVKETYTLFLKRCIQLLLPGGRLTFIVPDTFLALNLHKDTRHFLLSNTTVEDIVIFPSKFFPGVNFGYSNLCIITLSKNEPDSSHALDLLEIKSSPDVLSEVTSGIYSNLSYKATRNQLELLHKEGHGFNVGADSSLEKLINSKSVTTLGDLARCVTGFYSGDNSYSLAVKEHRTASLEKYELVSEDQIEEHPEDLPHILEGLDNQKSYIPLHKGGKGLFLQESEWFVRWTQTDVTRYKTDKKARFQNPTFYFREGLAVPMVRSKKMKATLLDRRLFDQSVVGIFPHDEGNLFYLLAFFNSEIATKLINSINHTANNSANYLKRIPIIIDDDEKPVIDKIVSQLLVDRNVERALKEINPIFSRIYDKLLLG